MRGWQPCARAGRALFEQRMGQLDLSCAHCHDAAAGRRLGGSPIPQAHPTGYPIYRLEWQGLGSLQRRLRDCLSGVRAEPFAWGARGVDRAGAVPGLARPRHAAGDAGRAALRRLPLG